mgnify:CR=1 FL=1
MVNLIQMIVAQAATTAFEVIMQKKTLDLIESSERNGTKISAILYQDIMRELLFDTCDRYSVYFLCCVQLVRI